MGFTDAHIRAAREALGVRVDDTGARTVNRCATWMIDHPLADDMMAGYVGTSSSSQPHVVVEQRGRWTSITTVGCQQESRGDVFLPPVPPPR